MSDEKQQEYSPNKLFDTYQHLAPATLYKMFGQPHSVALGNSLVYDDLLQSANLGLWKACLNYKPNQSNFKTYAINHIKWAVKNTLNRTRLIKYNYNSIPDKEDKINLVSFDYPYTSNDNDSSLTLEEIISEQDSDFSKESTSNLLLSKMSEELNSKEKNIIRMRLQDKTNTEIAKYYNVSSQAITNQLHNIRKKLHKYREDIVL